MVTEVDAEDGSEQKDDRAEAEEEEREVNDSWLSPRTTLCCDDRDRE